MLRFEQIFNGLIWLLENTLRDVTLCDFTKSDDGRLVVLPRHHGFGAIGQLASAFGGHQH